MDDMDYKFLIDSFAMGSLGNILDSMDPSGTMRKLAECLYVHQMPVRQIMPFLIDYGKLIKKEPKEDKQDG